MTAEEVAEFLALARAAIDADRASFDRWEWAAMPEDVRDHIATAHKACLDLRAKIDLDEAARIGAGNGKG